MSGDKIRNSKGNSDEEKEEPGASDSDLGNLPPLSDFESGAGEQAPEGELPLLSGLDSESGRDSGSLGGLPPLGEISVETPKPTGGQIKPPPPGFETPLEVLKTDSDWETPQTPAAGTSFQDLAADSDFSPETPEIGPGPESDVETPMFDSAFGARDSDFGAAVETPAPTQAMETPMFEVGPTPSPGALDRGALGVEPSGEFEMGTPVPDFSPDTGIPGVTAPSMPPMAPPPAKKKAKKAARSLAVTALVLVVVGLVGLFAGPWVSKYVSLIPNPIAKERDQAKTEASDLKDQLQRIQRATQPGELPSLSPADVQKLITQKEQLATEIDGAKKERDDTLGKLEQAKQDFQLANADVEAKSKDFVQLQESYEDLSNELAISRARHEGLLAEIERLTDQVGKLEDANARRLATKDTLDHCITRLEVLVKEGCPLTPEKYAWEKRTAGVEDLKQRVSAAKWVSPELLDEFTSLYLTELSIAASHEYFFAKIPVKDRFGTESMKWAECLTNGNWSVYFVTIDGQNAGSYEKTTESGAPMYEFRQDLPDPVLKQIRKTVHAARVPDYEKQVAALAEREGITNPMTPLQRLFSSL